MKQLPIIAGLLLTLVVIAAVVIVRTQAKRSADSAVQLLWKQTNDNLSEFSLDVGGLSNDRNSLRTLRARANHLADQSSDLRSEAAVSKSVYGPLVAEVAEKEQKYARNVGDAVTGQVTLETLHASEQTLLDEIARIHDRTMWTGSPDRADLQIIDDKIVRLIRLPAPGNSTRRRGVTHRSFPNPKNDSTGEPWMARPTGFMISDSDSRILTTADLQGLSNWELDLIRNEIYARRGRPFLRGKYRAYFARQPWYHVNVGYSDADLNPIEKRNAAFVLSYQGATGRSTR